MKTLRTLLFWCFCCLAITNCTPKKAEKNLVKKGASLVESASTFNLFQQPDGYLLEVNRTTQSGGDTMRYILSALPQEKVARNYPNYTYIQTPVKNVVSSSATQVAYIDALKQCSSIKAAKTANYIYNKQVKKQLKNGRTIALNGNIESDKEQLINLKPDLIIAVGYDTQIINAYKQLANFGIGSIVISDWLETSLLGRLEWLKVFGVLYGKTTEANTIYTSVAHTYDSLRNLASQIPQNQRPEIYTAVPFKGVWYMPGGNSYLGKLYKDAALDYVYSADTSTGSLHLSLEQVMADCQEIPNWLLNDNVFSAQDLLAIDSRLALFKAFKNKQMFNFNAQIDEDNMGNAYWELGITHPHWILSDLLYFFHPQLFTDKTYTPHFYHRFE